MAKNNEFDLTRLSENQIERLNAAFRYLRERAAFLREQKAAAAQGYEPVAASTGPGRRGQTGGRDE